MKAMTQAERDTLRAVLASKTDSGVPGREMSSVAEWAQKAR